jgi:hypothetical protein
MIRRIGASGYLVGMMVLAGASPGRSQPEEAALRRVVVRVEPVPLGERPADERPAMIRLVAADFAPGRRIDPASIQVVRHDPQSSRDLSPPLPIRWYDEAIPYDFPECEDNVHAGDGISLRFTARPRWGDFYNILGDGLGGRLAWTHRQDGAASSEYTISFRLLAKGERPDRLPPRG